MTEVDQRAILRAALLSAASEVFENEPELPGAGASAEFVAVIGFTGRQVQGSLLVGTSREVARSYLRDHLGRDPTDDDMGDWVGEMANLTLGRLKFGLYPQGVEIHLSTPVLLHGLGLAWRETQRCEAASLCAGGVAVRAWFDLRPVAWVPPPADERGLSGGEIELF